jgi:two-component system sensor histidine kinase KdpD
MLNLWLQHWSGYEALALVYLLAVVLLALFVGRGPILFGTALTALGWNFLFIPPRYSLHIGSFYDKMMFTMYFVVALTVGQLTARLRALRIADQKREERSTALYLLTRELAEAPGFADVLDRGVRHLELVFDAEIAIFLSRSGSNELVIFPGSSWQPGCQHKKSAQNVFNDNQRGIVEVEESNQTKGIYVLLSAGGQPSGVVGLMTELNSDQRELLESFVGQIALVLDRQRLRDSELNTRLLKESERLSRTLLNSVSHELRTPIAAIISAAGSMRTSGNLTPIQKHLAAEIEAASTRLNRVVQGLLSAARLQSGQVRPNLDWCEITDVVRVTLRNLGKLVSSHPIEKRFEPGLPLVKADFVLLEQALANLVANAVTHTPHGTSIAIAARVEGKELVLEVADRGPGLLPEHVPHMFDLFHRTPGAKPGGVGLGLAIVKGFVEAQHGRVLAANRADGGAVFSICMPITDAPSLPEEKP